MSITLEQLSAKMRQGEQVPLQQTAQIVLTLSIPSILQQIVVTAMEYIDAAARRPYQTSATASIGIVSSSTWLLHGMLAGCIYLSIQVAQYPGCRPGGGCPGRAAAVNPCCFNPVRRSGGSRFRHWHQPVSAQLAGGDPAGGCLGLILPSLGGFPALCHAPR